MLLRQKFGEMLGLDLSSFIGSSLEALTYFFTIILIYLILKNTFIKVIKGLIARTGYEFLINFSKSRVLRFMTLLVPFSILYAVRVYLQNPIVANVYEKTIFTTIVVVSLLLMFAIVNVLSDLSEENERVREKFPVKPVFQIFKVIIFIVAVITIIAHFIDQSPIYFLSGLGAISAIIMFIFKDSIQSLVAAFQITLHKSVKRGDWIEVPKYLVDGEVKEINLNVVSVKNWDNTTTVIPTYVLLTESFKNWTTMYKTGRRIKRAINIDVNSVKQLDLNDIAKLKQVKLIKQYLEEKEQDLTKLNSDLDNDDLLAVNGKKLTNIGTFRKYIEYYLKQHPEILQDQLLVVRQLANVAQGLPIEIYCFTGKTSLQEFEGVQSDIFDHLYSIVTLFGLNVYQQTSGRDFSSIGNELANIKKSL